MSSNDTYETVLTRKNFRSDGDWERVQQAAHETYGLPANTLEVPICKRYVFEEIKTIPQDWDRSLLSLIVGSHDPAAQLRCNKWMPTKVFNLSITNDEIINKTHARMAECFHESGGEWKREYMPRTAMVFLHDDEGNIYIDIGCCRAKLYQTSLAVLILLDCAAQVRTETSKVERWQV